MMIMMVRMGVMMMIMMIRMFVMMMMSYASPHFDKQCRRQIGSTPPPAKWKMSFRRGARARRGLGGAVVPPGLAEGRNGFRPFCEFS